MIDRVGEKVREFLKEILEIREAGGEVRIVGVESADEDWIAEAEVVERNLVLPSHLVFEKNRYIVRLSADLEVSSYRQEKSGKEEEE